MRGRVPFTAQPIRDDTPRRTVHVDDEADHFVRKARRTECIFDHTQRHMVIALAPVQGQAVDMGALGARAA